MLTMYRADFHYQMSVPARVRGGKTFPVTVTVTNSGNLLDIARIDLYSNALLGSHRFEIPPGETRAYSFDVALFKAGTQTLTAIVCKQAVTRSVTVIEIQK
jgi:hypothetical protein